jgi:hypothetical protein
MRIVLEIMDGKRKSLNLIITEGLESCRKKDIHFGEN